MAAEDEHLAKLIKATMTTGCQYLALGLAQNLRVVRSAASSTLAQTEEVAAAETTWRSATKALADYRAARRGT